MAEVLTRVRFRYLCRLLLDLRYYFIPSFPIGNPIYQFAQFAIGLEEGKECILAGTLNMHMKLKPCVLDEYSEEGVGVRTWLSHLDTRSDLMPSGPWLVELFFQIII
ncbi:DNA polymerase delta small subunit-like isoform X2 [Juglans microcarpa x Juglans regia]|uniref:DNA polymerase delta small subunit-like isoform X2 n=1 Tax=Juglans microcarpa x Juglans regia TaxID=2249226 RepID=UPI001B7DC74C|nr:DNA polymerase delta small subunit-like isoform X2 [Juglans microcarpa x Juglans regia]